MKSLKITAILVALPLAAAAQDSAKVDPGHYKVLVDNGVIRVLKVSYGPGEKSPMHSHPDAMLVPLATGKARFTMPDGKTQDRELVAEIPDYTPAFTHAPANIGRARSTPSWWRSRRRPPRRPLCRRHVRAWP